MDQITVLNDGETYSGTSGSFVLLFHEDRVSAAAAEEEEAAGEIETLVGEVEDDPNKGEKLSIEKMAEVYLAVRDRDDLPPDLAEIVNNNR